MTNKCGHYKGKCGYYRDKCGHYRDTENSLVFSINLMIFQSPGILKKKNTFRKLGPPQYSNRNFGTHLLTYFLHKGPFPITGFNGLFRQTTTKIRNAVILDAT